MDVTPSDISFLDFYDKGLVCHFCTLCDVTFFKFSDVQYFNVMSERESCLGNKQCDFYVMDNNPSMIVDART